MKRRKKAEWTMKERLRRKYAKKMRSMIKKNMWNRGRGKESNGRK